MLRKRTLYKCLLLLGGLYATGLGLWRLGAAAVFVHEAVVVPGVVVDVRERPFEDYWEALAHGNLPWEGEVAHQPHVIHKYAAPAKVDTTLPDLDNHDYDRGQAIEIIVHPDKPEQRHINKFKFVWGEHLITLALGLVLLLIWRLSLRWRRRRSPGKPRRRQESVVVVEAPLPIAEPEPPKPKRRRSPAKPKDPTAPAKPRKSSAKSAAKDDAPAPKKRRKRKATPSTSDS